jgi:hypothetical protein
MRIKARRKHRRERLIELLGGERVRCGAADDLEFDHIDPKTKAFAVGSDMSRAWSQLVEEALKTQLLCRPCHVVKGKEDRPEPSHGYYRYWYYGYRVVVLSRELAQQAHERGMAGGISPAGHRCVPVAWPAWLWPARPRRLP